MSIFYNPYHLIQPQSYVCRDNTVKSYGPKIFTPSHIHCIQPSAAHVNKLALYGQAIQFRRRQSKTINLIAKQVIFRY